jgi:hypothetical protein
VTADARWGRGGFDQRADPGVHDLDRPAEPFRVLGRRQAARQHEAAFVCDRHERSAAFKEGADERGFVGDTVEEDAQDLRAVFIGGSAQIQDDLRLLRRLIGPTEGTERNPVARGGLMPVHHPVEAKEKLDGAWQRTAHAGLNGHDPAYPFALEAPDEVEMPAAQLGRIDPQGDGAGAICRGGRRRGFRGGCFCDEEIHQAVLYDRVSAATSWMRRS